MQYRRDIDSFQSAFLYFKYYFNHTIYQMDSVFIL